MTVQQRTPPKTKATAALKNSPRSTNHITVPETKPNNQTCHLSKQTAGQIQKAQSKQHSLRNNNKNARNRSNKLQHILTPPQQNQKQAISLCTHIRTKTKQPIVIKALHSTRNAMRLQFYSRQ
jgi:hypothetical protein